MDQKFIFVSRCDLRNIIRASGTNQNRIASLVFLVNDFYPFFRLDFFDNESLYDLTEALEDYFFWIYAAVSFLILVVERRKQQSMERTIENVDLIEISIA